MDCRESIIHYLSWGFIIGGLAYCLHQTRSCAPYGRYTRTILTCPAKTAWFLQELTSFLVPLFLLLTTESQTSLGKKLLICTFCLHYFQRTFIYALLTKGQPFPISLMVYSAIFCSLNGFLQGHYLLHCAQFEDTQLADVRLVAGLLLFFLGMGINVHSDHILRSLRRPGETIYRIPHGGMFEFVSGANFFGEILEWCGYAAATWSLPTFSFAFFTICSIGPRAYCHHKYYKHKFKDYPQSRKAIIPFIL